MSDVLADYSQLGLTPDEMLQANKDMYARALKGANAAISMPATMIAPDPHLTDMIGGPKVLNYIPYTGALEGAAGLGGAILNAGSDLGNLVTQRYGLTIPRVPTGAAEHFEATRSAIKDKIGEYTPLPAPDMNDVADRYTDLGGSLLGSLVPIVPGGLAAAMPRGLQTVTGFLGPTASHIPQNAAIVSGLGLVGATGLAAKDARAESKANAVGSGFNDFLKQPDAPAPVPTSPGPTATQPLAATPPPVDINTGLNAALSGQDKPPAPTFEASQGPSSDTVLDTLFTIGGVLTAVGIAKYTHSIRGAATSADRNARFTNPAYAQAAQDYNNSVIARGGSIAPEGLDTATPPPLPEANKFRQATNAANTQVLDQNAQMMDAIRAIGEPSTSEKIAHMYGNTHTDASHEVRLDTFLRTGLDEKSGVRIPPPADLFRDIANLNEEQQNRLNIGLNSKNELDNRNNNARLFRQQNPGKTPTADDIRHDFKDFDDQQLRIEAAKMDNDPLLAGLAQRFRGITNGQLDIGQAHGFFPAAEVANLKATHPNYVPEVGPGGETLHPFGARPTGVMTGVSNVNSRAWYNLAQHIEELHHQFELNASNRDLWQTQKDAQRQFPNSAQFMTEVKPTNTAYSFYGNEMGTFREPIVAIRTDTGPKYVRVDHPDFYNAMTGDSIKKRQIARDLLTIPRRLYQQGTTGAVSALTGRLYPPVNAGYTSMLMATNAPHNMYGGLLDKGVQRLTGQTSSLARGVDMVTNLPYVAGSYLRGVADRRVNNIADLLRPDRVPDQGAIAGFFSQRLQPLLGNATVQSLQQSMKDYYLNSTTNKIRAMGIGGQGTPIKSDLPALNIQGSKQARLVAARTVPELFFSGKWMGSKPFLLRLNRVIQEAMTNMSDAGHDAFARLNYNNPTSVRRRWPTRHGS